MTATVATDPPPFFIVINAGSGHNDSAQSERTIAAVLDAAGRRHEFLRIDDPARMDAVIAEAVRKAAECHGVVVGAGGDGTLNAVARQVLAAGLPYAVLPQGTFNYFGRAQGISQDVEASARGLLQGRIAPVQVGRVNGRVFLVNASLGLYPQILEDREAFKQRHGRSRANAVWSGLLTLLRHRRQLRLEIDAPDGRRRVRTPTVFVGNNRLQLEQIGIEEGPSDAGAGGLAAIIVRPIGWLAMFGLALRGALGRLGEAENVDTFAFRRLEVRVLGQRRCKVAIDGEILWLQTPLVFDVSPQPLRLLLPSAADRVEVA